MRTDLATSKGYYHAVFRDVWNTYLGADMQLALTISDYDREKAKNKIHRFMPPAGCKHFAESQETAYEEIASRSGRELNLDQIGLNREETLKLLRKQVVTLCVFFKAGLKIACLEAVEAREKCRLEFIARTGHDPDHCVQVEVYGPSCDAASKLEEVGRQNNQPIAGIRYRSVKHPGGFCLAAFDPWACHERVQLI